MSEEGGLRKPVAFGLALRLGMLGVLAAVLVAGAGGWVLRDMVHATVTRGFMQGLAARAERIESRLRVLPGGGVGEERSRAADVFDQIFSGWYWQLRTQEGERIVLRSRSQWDAGMLQARAAASGSLAASGPRGEPLFGLVRPLALGERAFVLEVFGPAEQVTRDLARLDRGLLLVALALMLGWMAATWVQVRIGLRPLRRLRRRVAEVEGGGGAIGHGYGADLDPLAEELDAMLLRNARLVARARAHAADLSHALKKPLTLLAAESGAAAAVSGDLVRRQVDSMSALIDRHLVRAASAAAAEAVLRRLEVAGVLMPLLNLMQALHQARALQWQADVAADLAWRGDQADLEEMLGNLLDNAGKWAATRVRVRGGYEAAGDVLVIVVEDDGPGLDARQIEQAARRGQRFDEAVEGSGLGLAIAADIAATYEGELRLERSAELGGLQASLRLPV